MYVATVVHLIPSDAHLLEYSKCEYLIGGNIKGQFFFFQGETSIAPKGQNSNSSLPPNKTTSTTTTPAGTKK